MISFSFCSLTLKPRTMKQFFVLSCLAAVASATFPITATVGTTAYVLSAASATNGAIALGLLGVAKAALLGAALANRGKRSVTAPIDFTQMFDNIDAQDQSNCGKLLVCHAFAKNPEKLSGEERAVIGLFDDLSVIQPNTYGKFQWAAFTGTFKNAAVCKERYSNCPVQAEKLANMINLTIEA
jgi:hypothetical protein